MIKQQENVYFNIYIVNNLLGSLHLVSKMGDEKFLKAIIESGFYDLNYKNEKSQETSLVNYIYYLINYLFR